MSGIVATGSYTFTSKQESTTGERHSPSVVNYKDEVLLLIGGWTESAPSKSVELFWLK